MKNQISFSSKAREQAVRMVFEQQKERESQWSAVKSIASKNCTAETLRTSVRSAETDQGIRSSVDIGSRTVQASETKHMNSSMNRLAGFLISSSLWQHPNNLYY